MLANATAREACERSKELIAASQRLCEDARRAKRKQTR
jgi:hypothetical protein